MPDASDEAEGRTFLLCGFDLGFGLLMLRPHDCGSLIEGGQHSATMLRLGLLQSDCERGFYNVEAVTQALQGIHGHASPVFAYWLSLRDH